MYLSDLPPPPSSSLSSGRFWSRGSSGPYLLLRQLPPLFLFPLVALYAVDLRRYAFNHSSDSQNYDSVLPLDIAALVVLGLGGLWHVVWSVSALVQLSQEKDDNSPKGMRLEVAGFVDFFMWAGVFAIGNTSLSMWCNPKLCVNYINGCGSDTQNINVVAGALMIILAVVYQSTLWSLYQLRSWAKQGLEHPSTATDLDL